MLSRRNLFMLSFMIRRNFQIRRLILRSRLRRVMTLSLTRMVRSLLVPSQKGRVRRKFQLMTRRFIVRQIRRVPSGSPLTRKIFLTKFRVIRGVVPLKLGWRPWRTCHLLLRLMVSSLRSLLKIRLVMLLSLVNFRKCFIPILGRSVKRSNGHPWRWIMVPGPTCSPLSVLPRPLSVLIFVMNILASVRARLPVRKLLSVIEGVPGPKWRLIKGLFLILSPLPKDATVVTVMDVKLKITPPAEDNWGDTCST